MVVKGRGWMDENARNGNGNLGIGLLLDTRGSRDTSAVCVYWV